jgi:hypothetical protein
MKKTGVIALCFVLLLSLLSLSGCTKASANPTGKNTPTEQGQKQDKDETSDKTEDEQPEEKTQGPIQPEGKCLDGNEAKWTSPTTYKCGEKGEGAVMLPRNTQ